jgi:hypothetical protein
MLISKLEKSKNSSKKERKITEKTAGSVQRLADRTWIPACAGMTNIKNQRLFGVNSYIFEIFLDFSGRMLYNIQLTNRQWRIENGKLRIKRTLPFTIYDLRFTIFSFLPRHQRNPRLLTISRCSFVVNLKKQTQFLKGQIGANAVMTMVYGHLSDWRQGKNEAKQSQFTSH